MGLSRNIGSLTMTSEQTVELDSLRAQAKEITGARAKLDCSKSSNERNFLRAFLKAEADENPNGKSGFFRRYHTLQLSATGDVVRRELDALAAQVRSATFIEGDTLLSQSDICFINEIDQMVGDVLPQYEERADANQNIDYWYVRLQKGAVDAIRGLNEGYRNLCLKLPSACHPSKALFRDNATSVMFDIADFFAFIGEKPWPHGSDDEGMKRDLKSIVMLLCNVVEKLLDKLDTEHICLVSKNDFRIASTEICGLLDRQQEYGTASFAKTSKSAMNAYKKGFRAIASGIAKLEVKPTSKQDAVRVPSRSKSLLNALHVDKRLSAHQEKCILIFNALEYFRTIAKSFYEENHKLPPMPTEKDIQMWVEASQPEKKLTLKQVRGTLQKALGGTINQIKEMLRTDPSTIQKREATGMEQRMPRKRTKTFHDREAFLARHSDYFDYKICVYWVGLSSIRFVTLKHPCKNFADAFKNYRSICDIMADFEAKVPG